MAFFSTLACIFLCITFWRAECLTPNRGHSHRIRRIKRTASNVTSGIPTTAIGAILHTGYDYMQPPKAFEPTGAKIGMYINSFRSIDTKDMSFSLTFYLRQQWTDPRLQYNPATRDHTSHYVHPDLVKKVWRPDLFMRHEIESHVYDFTTPNQLMTILPNGSVWYVIKVTAILSCPMKLGNYPFDTQRYHFREFRVQNGRSVFSVDG